jgi:hypothetical protein
MVISLKGRFVSGESREYYMLMPLHNDGHWLHYKMVVQGSNVILLDVLAENGYREDDLWSFDDVGFGEWHARLI